MRTKLASGVGLVVAVVLYATAAFALPDATAVAAVDGGAVTLRDTLVEIAETVLPYAAALLAIGMGWRLARKFVRA